MKYKILITGGAGFIGTHLAIELIRNGHHVRILDSLNEQVHGENPTPPDYLPDEVEFIRGNILDAETVKKSLQGIDAVYHFAALVGVGQSMYEMINYTDVNNLGTAVLLDQLTKNPVKKLIVASSMSIYGEGLYLNNEGEKVEDAIRKLEDLKNGNWEPYDRWGSLKPIPTSEDKVPDLSSVYALSKYDQEKLCLLIGKAYNIPTVALRFFNVYGPYQSLSNPYTGVLAIFASRLLNNKSPLIFEDGLQKRDFVNVKDVARGCMLALENEQVNNDVFNIGSGKVYSILGLAEKMAASLNKAHIEPEVTGQYRQGDIRHCFADITKARKSLGYQPKVSLEEGIVELADWLKDQVAVDKVSTMRKELETRGLAV